MELEKTKWWYNIVNALTIHLKTVNFMLYDFSSIRERKKEKGIAEAGQASGKARQVSQTTLGPTDLRESDVEVNKQEKVSESVFLLSAMFADTTFQHSLFPTFLL